MPDLRHADSLDAEAAPLLQNDEDTLMDRPTCVVREKTRASSGPLDESFSPNIKCYLQDGGETASGKRVTKKLILACSLAFAFMIFECVGGYFAQSVAILSDAAHMFSDVFSFVVSIYCMRLINMKATSTYSFGYHRAETMGALISVLIVCVITGGLVLEAVQRLINPTSIDGRLMFIVAVAGIGFNVLLLLTLGHDHHHHLGGSCGHDHGDGHGHHHGHGHNEAHSHVQSHSHGHGQSCVRQDDPQDHGHTLCDMSNVVGCSSTHDGDHNHGEQLTDGPCGTGCSHRGKSDHAYDHHQEHDHDHDHSSESTKAAHEIECLGMEKSCSSQGASLLVKMQSGDTSNTLQQSRLDGPTSDACDHGGSRHAHHHSHGNGGACAGPHEDHHNQNLRGAIVHVLGDILQSVGVAIAGAILWYTDSDPKWLWVDPACTFVFAISVVWVTKTLIVDITQDLMEASPNDVDVSGLTVKVSAVPGVTGIHDLHVWRIGTGKVILTAHIDVADKSDPYNVIQCVEEVICSAGISHSTVQICSGKVEASA